MSARRMMAAWLYREIANASNRRIDHWERIAIQAERDRDWAGWALSKQKQILSPELYQRAYDRFYNEMWDAQEAARKRVSDVLEQEDRRLARVRRALRAWVRG